MHSASRRKFLQQSGVAASAIGIEVAAVTHAKASESSTSSTVFMDQDGMGMTPGETCAQLARLCAQREPATDTYMLGGAVEDVEQYFAKVLGKERAVFMPTGTLANQISLRALAGSKRRVLLQDVSHIYNDTGDASQTLSGLTLLPMAPDRASFSWDEVERQLGRTASGRVKTTIGAISIESPVRRRSGELFDRGEMLRICSQAKERGIATHLDGARLFIACAYTGVTPADYAAPFDTVYVSLWKYFNAMNGAILAGPAALLDEIYHTRRMFGGALFNAWPFALLARHYAEGFVERLQAAIAASREFIDAAPSIGMRIEQIPNGTNIFRFTVDESRALPMLECLRKRNVILAKPAVGAPGATFNVYVNETWNRISAPQLVQHFRAALKR